MTREDLEETKRRTSSMRRSTPGVLVQSNSGFDMVVHHADALLLIRM